MASDRLGRKRVIIFGLLLFAIGSFVAAWAPSLTWLAIGRALQGAGAVSAAVTALLADQTRDEVRTKSMALVGISIGLMFALSLVAAPMLVAVVGLNGLFAVTGTLALLGVAAVIWWVPPEPQKHKDMARGGLLEVLRLLSSVPLLLALQQAALLPVGAAGWSVLALYALASALWLWRLPASAQGLQAA